ncbi:MAG: hypothetical protein ACRD82_20045, partial [Blastocatellia bacterium]
FVTESGVMTDGSSERSEFGNNSGPSVFRETATSPMAVLLGFQLQESLSAAQQSFPITVRLNRKIN